MLWNARSVMQETSTLSTTTEKDDFYDGFYDGFFDGASKQSFDETTRSDVEEQFSGGDSMGDARVGEEHSVNTVLLPQDKKASRTKSREIFFRSDDEAEAEVRAGQSILVKHTHEAHMVSSSFH